MKGYIDDVAKFNGETWAGVRIGSDEVKGRALDLVVPKGATEAQQSVLKSMTEYGKKQGVDVSVKVF